LPSHQNYCGNALSGVKGNQRFLLINPIIATITINGQDYKEIEDVKKANQEIVMDIK